MPLFSGRLMFKQGLIAQGGRPVIYQSGRVSLTTRNSRGVMFQYHQGDSKEPIDFTWGEATRGSTSVTARIDQSPR